MRSRLSSVADHSYVMPRVSELAQHVDGVLLRESKAYGGECRRMSGAMRIWHSSPDQMEPYGDCSALTLVHLRSGCETTQQNNALLHNGEGLLTGSGYLPSGIFSASRFHWSTCAAHTLNLGYKLLLTVRRFGALNQCIESDVIRVKSGKTIPRQYYARSNRPAIHRLC